MAQVQVASFHNLVALGRRSGKDIRRDQVSRAEGSLYTFGGRNSRISGVSGAHGVAEAGALARCARIENQQ